MVRGDRLITAGEQSSSFGIRELSPMAIKFVLFLFFLTVEGEQSSSYRFLVLRFAVIKVTGEALRFMRSKFSHS